MPRLPRDTNQQDLMHAAADRGFSQELIYFDIYYSFFYAVISLSYYLPCFNYLSYKSVVLLVCDLCLI